MLGALTLLNLAGAEAVAAVSNAAMYLDQCRVIAAIGLRVVCLCAAAGLRWAGGGRRPRSAYETHYLVHDGLALAARVLIAMARRFASRGRRANHGQTYRTVVPERFSTP